MERGGPSHQSTGPTSTAGPLSKRETIRQFPDRGSQRPRQASMVTNAQMVAMTSAVPG